MSSLTLNETQSGPTETPRRLPHTKIPTHLFAGSDSVAAYVAGRIAKLICENNSAGLPTVLGLPTGSTPIGVYRELIRLHKEDGLDLSNVITFNLDEYWPMDARSIHSYHRWMCETFFNHVNISKGNIHIPPGDLPREKIDDFCEEYEQQIEQAGGIQLMLLGIGRTGHIGFNEPGSSRTSRTRLVTLDPVTRRDAASDFYGEENVPQQALTMGVGTILSAKRVIVVALGEHKAEVVRRAVECEVTPDVAASFLQTHPQAEFVVDAAAAERLTAVATPWLFPWFEWTADAEKRAVIWLSQQTGKPLLKLEDHDFLQHHLHHLIHERGPTNAVRQRVFDSLMSTICSTPGGEEPQTVLVFSPHPDDDVISMGGTLITLAEQGHDVHIAYMTSGNIAVFDHDALRHVDYLEEFLELFGLGCDESRQLIRNMSNAVASKKPGDVDCENLLKIKTLVRKTEATAAAKEAGVPDDKLHFLDLPFYRTGEVTKRPVGEEDVKIVADLIRELKPGQIYMAGDLSDPHGTHRLCAQAIIRALEDLNAMPLLRTGIERVESAENTACTAEAVPDALSSANVGRASSGTDNEGLHPEVWLYRGAWEEYDPHEMEMVVPLSPETMLRKKLAIFKHESQKDRALFPGHDEREFWVRADERTRNTARIYNELGLPEYVALEGFVRLAGQL